MRHFRRFNAAPFSLGFLQVIKIKPLVNSQKRLAHIPLVIPIRMVFSGNFMKRKRVWGKISTAQAMQGNSVPRLAGE